MTGYTKKYGIPFLLSDEDNDLLDLTWYVDKRGYAKTNVRVGPGEFKSEPFHRIVMARLGHDVANYEVDHINKVRLDNRRENLRMVTPLGNSWNRELPPGKTGIRNITTLPSGSYRVSITMDWEDCRKTFKNLDDAIAYRDAMLEVRRCALSEQ